MRKTYSIVIIDRLGKNQIINIRAFSPQHATLITNRIQNRQGN